MRRKGSPSIGVLVGLVVAVIVVVLMIGLFSGIYRGHGKSANGTAVSTDIDTCDSRVSTYCRSLPDADWGESHPGCTEHADILGEGSTKCSDYVGAGKSSSEDSQGDDDDELGDGSEEGEDGPQDSDEDDETDSSGATEPECEQEGYSCMSPQLVSSENMDAESRDFTCPDGESCYEVAGSGTGDDGDGTDDTSDDGASLSADEVESVAVSGSQACYIDVYENEGLSGRSSTLSGPVDTISGIAGEMWSYRVENIDGSDSDCGAVLYQYEDYKESCLVINMDGFDCGLEAGGIQEALGRVGDWIPTPDPEQYETDQREANLRDADGVWGRRVQSAQVYSNSAGTDRDDCRLTLYTSESPGSGKAYAMTGDNPTFRWDSISFSIPVVGEIEFGGKSVDSLEALERSDDSCTFTLYAQENFNGESTTITPGDALRD